ncbi:PD-(D/E)XK nuclease family protein [Arthrobacter sp. zg-Y1110]|uniref:RecB family exonuclease n=1 Tax=Arthrobacter sp. zg-Y1110 TaxID=2886932 RepID=UPI001D15CD25|nr:PD-(D/E)XK nuclease family protein [Arthrobacter sp. zg-Y1110]MCC3292851.1 PD-(D/E)XK nuclease family protein [Arthrobacter sp. zg-Y1110]UWX86790.1 PD-(D/E)XK nuclease family protein [Arthrobacter sp. zg-Y1110]
MTTITLKPPLLRDKVAWDGKKLVVTDDSLIDSQLRRKALSASTSKSMQSCAARWVGERLLRSDDEDPFAPAPLGTSAHAVLEDLYALPGHQRTMREAEKITVRYADKMWADDPGASDALRAAVKIARSRWIGEVMTAYEGIFVIEDPKSIIVKGREHKIDGVVIRDVPTVGFIDRISEGTVDGVTGLIPEDYKTGKVLNTYFGDDHGDQVRIYGESVRIEFGEMPVAGKVLYTKFGKSRDIDLSKRAMDKTLKVFQLSWKRHNNYMKSQAFPTKVSALCGWCPLVNSCPVAKAEGKKVSEKVADQIPSATDLGIPTLRPGLVVPAPAAVADRLDDDSSDTVTFFPPDEDDHPEEAAALGRAAESAAHIGISGQNPDELSEEEHMAIIEGKPWDTYTKNGELNPISYTAIGVFGIAEMALEELHKAGQPVTGKNVKALAATFRHVIVTAQDEWTGSTSMADAANTRLRGALRSVLATMPMPFGQPKEAWDEWVSKAVKRCSSIVAVAHYVFEGVEDAEPWGNLSTGPTLSVVPEPAAEAAEPEAEKAAEEEPAPVARKARPARRVVKPVPAPAEDETEADEFEEDPKPEPKAKPKPVTITVDDLEFPADDDEDEFAYGA